MSSNSLFFIFLISFALVACNSSPKDKKSCFVEIEVEYSDEHDNMFNQFSEMFEDSSSSIENPKISKPEVVEEEEEEDEENSEEYGDEYTKVDHLIPSEIKNNCAVETIIPSNNLIKNFKKLCMNHHYNFSFHSVTYKICPALCQTNNEYMTYFVLNLNNICNFLANFSLIFY
jgi:hypothetical protein